MVTNRKINISGSYISCGKESSLTYFGKRTVLNSKNIGSKFCFRSMMTARTVLKTSSLRCTFGQIKRSHLGVKSSQKRYISDERFNQIQEENKVEIRKIKHKKNDPTSDHFVIQNSDEKKKQTILTHSKMSSSDIKKDNPVFASSDLFGNSYSEKKSPVQRGVERKEKEEIFPNKLKKVPWNQREKIKEDSLSRTVKMFKIRNESPEIFDRFQEVHREIHNNKKLLPSEKLEATQYLEDWAFSDHQKKTK